MVKGSPKRKRVTEVEVRETNIDQGGAGEVGVRYLCLSIRFRMHPCACT